MELDGLHIRNISLSCGHSPWMSVSIGILSVDHLIVAIHLVAHDARHTIESRVQKSLSKFFPQAAPNCLHWNLDHQINGEFVNYKGIELVPATRKN